MRAKVASCWLPFLRYIVPALFRHSFLSHYPLLAFSRLRGAFWRYLWCQEIDSTYSLLFRFFNLRFRLLAGHFVTFDVVSHILRCHFISSLFTVPLLQSVIKRSPLSNTGLVSYWLHEKYTDCPSACFEWFQYINFSSKRLPAIALDMMER